MAVQITFCTTCAQALPRKYESIYRLQQEYPHDLHIRTVECMAACDAPPTVCIDGEYHLKLSPVELEERLRAAIDAQQDPVLAW